MNYGTLMPLAKNDACSPMIGGRGADRRAFTLVELLVVIAITVVLFTLLLRPLVESLRLTQSAQIQAAAQDSARTTLERISRELGSAVYVYDGTSHPFPSSGNTAPAGAQTDHFTNFLDLEVLDSQGNPVVEHAYNAKLDIVPARHINGGQTDPTTGEPIHLRPGVGSATLSSNGLLFPLAPGSTITRYFVGLKDPTKPYANSNEGQQAAASSGGDNTYILYVAQVSPYIKSGGQTVINTQLFAVRKDASGRSVPELDDPDFFRYVADSDTDWLDDKHQSYAASGNKTAHDLRVDAWVKVAKSVITAPDIDLIQLPHNADGSIQYDAGTPPATCTSAGVCAGVSHSGVVYDPVPANGRLYPIINTTVTFRPGVVQGDAAPGTTTDYASLGLPANAADNGGLPYVPSFYTAGSRSWAYPYQIFMYLIGATQLPSTTNGYYYTDLGTGSSMYTQDMVEYMYSATGQNTSPTPVYDVTQGIPLVTTGNYVPLTVNPDAGTISFDQPALPDPPTATSPGTPTNRFWTVDVGALNGTSTTSLAYVPQKGTVDLTQLLNSPLPANGMALTGDQVANAHIVPGSLRVYGPDATPGPNQGNSVLYSQVSPGTSLDYNEYRVDYLNSQLYFYVDDSHTLPTLKTDNATPADDSTVNIAFDYQANLAPVDPTKPISAANPASAMLVKVNYQTRDLIAVNIGVRIYDSSQSRAVVIPLSSQIQIGNSNR